MTQISVAPQAVATQRNEGTPVPPENERHDELRAAAVALEASFLSEMLKHAGIGEARDAFGGGVGEEQFASMLRDEQARALSQSGGIGLAESLFQALVRRAESEGV